MVKGGKIISTGYNHHRPHYDGGELGTQGLRKVCKDFINLNPALNNAI